MPDEIQIRDAVPADAPAIADIHVRCWQAAYAGILPGDHLAALSIGKHTAFWEGELAGSGSITLVSVREGSITGWISGGGSRDDDGAKTSEIHAIYVSPDCWGGGSGKKLMEAMERHFPSGSPITLWVLEQNQRGIGFYQRLGFTAEGMTKRIRIGGAELAEIRLRKEWTPRDIREMMAGP
ncbi:GNAT family N-acetyltransferase [Luteolibacter sp. SL250]|uniref:GNAT family N-acetyltransferase n=1 Tax=Luteolibacter sp. SL250 TaxID=2995170 RepID=UPI002271A0F6|nr:GNAT family N-acetyltransferase [Luteolibacter sp. SL250]WAC20338.1 GNAT family N-acetyltransferase [Luteolibacter sp. SL250]